MPESEPTTKSEPSVPSEALNDHMLWPPGSGEARGWWHWSIGDKSYRARLVPAGDVARAADVAQTVEVEISFPKGWLAATDPAYQLFRLAAKWKEERIAFQDVVYECCRLLDHPGERHVTWREMPRRLQELKRKARLEPDQLLERARCLGRGGAVCASEKVLREIESLGLPTVSEVEAKARKPLEAQIADLKNRLAETEKDARRWIRSRVRELKAQRDYARDRAVERIVLWWRRRKERHLLAEPAHLEQAHERGELFGKPSATPGSPLDTGEARGDGSGEVDRVLKSAGQGAGEDAALDRAVDMIRDALSWQEAVTSAADLVDFQLGDDAEELICLARLIWEFSPNQLEVDLERYAAPTGEHQARAASRREEFLAEVEDLRKKAGR